MSLRLEEIEHLIDIEKATRGCGETPKVIVNVDGEELFITGIEYDQFHHEIRLNTCRPDAVPEFVWDDAYHDDPEGDFNEMGDSE